MLSLIIRKNNQVVEVSDRQGEVFSGEIIDCPFNFALSPKGKLFIPPSLGPRYIRITSGSHHEYHVETDLDKLTADGVSILPQETLKNVQKALNKTERILHSLSLSFERAIPFNYSLDKDVKYIADIIECFSKLIERNRALVLMQGLVDQANNASSEQFEQIKKNVLATIKLEDYDKSDNLKLLQKTLQRKLSEIESRQVMFIQLEDADLTLSEEQMSIIEEQIKKLNEQNLHIQTLINSIAQNFPEVRSLESIDALVKNFRNIINNYNIARELSAGKYLCIADYEIEISNIVDLENPKSSDNPFSNEITYKEVDNILLEISQNKSIIQQKNQYLNYLSKHSSKSPEELEKNLHKEISENISQLRDILRFDSRLLKFDKGTEQKPQILCRQGDFGNTAYFIISGSVEVLLDQTDPIPLHKLGQKSIKRKNIFQAFAQLFSNKHHIHEFRHKDHRSLSPDKTAIFIQDFDTLLKKHGSFMTATVNSGELFGELSAMGRTPRTATVVTKSPTVLLEIRWQGLRDLRETLSILKEITDLNYRERGLDAHLRSTEIFQNFSEEERQDIIKHTSFSSYGEFKWHMSYKEQAQKGQLHDLAKEPIIISEGDYPDQLILIRSGFARVSHRYNNGHLTSAYLGKGAVFGYDELKYNYENPHQQKNYSSSLRAIGHIDTLMIPKEQLEQYLFSRDPACHAQHLKNRVHDEAPLHIQPQEIDQGQLLLAVKGNELNQGLIESIVANRAMNGTQSMMINMDRCTRCDDCVVACANAHDGNPRFARHGQQIDNFMLANACMHCNDPVCMIGCPTGAIHRNDNGGEVIINDLTCIGCSTCANSCPYDNIRMVEFIEEGQDSIKVSPENNEALQKATKCDLCVDQAIGPACENACPHDALQRVDISNIQAVKQWLKQYQ